MKQKIANKLYHVTTKESDDHILNEGLFPQIGDNSRKAGEEDPVVFLCNRFPRKKKKQSERKL